MDTGKYVIVIYFNNGSIFQTDKISKTEADKIGEDFYKRKNIKYDVKNINSANVAMIETITEEVYEKRIMSNKFKCDYNENAKRCLQDSLEWLRKRTNERKERNVLGTNKV